MTGASPRGSSARRTPGPSSRSPDAAAPAAARDDRRVAEGFISPADARAFLELARRGGGGDARDPITHAYFRGVQESKIDFAPNGGEPTGPAGGDELAALLRDADVIAPPPAQRADPGVVSVVTTESA